MIPFLDLKPQNLGIGKKLAKDFDKFLKSGVYILGDQVECFEKNVAKFLDVPYAVGVASGTEAICLALNALGIGEGDEVVVPANSYPSVWGVLQSGAGALLCDINPQTFDLNLENLKSLIGKKTKAILVVHLFGFNMLSQELVKLAQDKKLIIIEDCAQAFGVKSKNKFLGTIGEAGIFSFYPTKPLGGLGDGGMVVTKSKEVYEKVKALRMYGEKSRYKSESLGINSRLDELQAAFLNTKLGYVEKWRKERLTLANLYKKLLKKVGDLEFVENKDWESSGHHLLVVKTKQRDGLMDYLKKNGVGIAIHYPLSLSQVDSIRKKVKAKKPVVAELLSGQILSLPLYNGLKKQQVKKIVKVTKKFYEIKS